MKKVFTFILIVLMLFTFNVNASEPDKENGLLQIGDKILYEKGRATEEKIEGIEFNADSMTLSISDEFVDNEIIKGIQIISMGDYFKINILSPSVYRVVGNGDSLVYSALYINNSEVTMNFLEGATLDLGSNGKNGIALINNSKLILLNGILNADAISLDETSIFEKKSDAKLTCSKIIAGNNEITLIPTDGEYIVDANTTEISSTINITPVIASEPERFTAKRLIFYLSCILGVAAIVLGCLFYYIRSEKKANLN